MTPVEPSAFAAQLIAKLEKLKREQDTMSSLEERLQQIQEVSIYKYRAFPEVLSFHTFYFSDLYVTQNLL